MFPPDARTLSGDVASPQHLAALHIPAAGLALPLATATTHLLLLSLQGRVACFHDGLGWHLEAGHHAWLVPVAPLTLRPASLRSCDLLAWRFQASALHADLHALLPSPGRTPAHGPAPLTPSMQTLLLALRSCPVAPTLRSLWGTAKLVELLTLILPAPPHETSDTLSPAPATRSRSLHPAIRTALDFMAARLSENIGLPEIAAAAHASPSHLSRLFTAEFGHGPTVHLRRLRLDHAAALLRSGQANVTEAALSVGYSSLGQFSRAFAEQHGQSPSGFLPRNLGT